MEWLEYLLHVDRYLAAFVAAYGPWIYALLFAIVFAETGLIVMPLLPGDSLLFAAGTLAAAGALDMASLVVLLCVAAILGDAVNYSIGRGVGRRAFRRTTVLRVWRIAVSPAHLQRARAFYERFGGKAIVLGRFVPIVRTFVPFVAGAVDMTYTRFLVFNVAGGILWVTVCAGAGYAFGQLPPVKDNFSLVVLGIVAISLIPVALELTRGRRSAPHRKCAN